MMRDGLGNGLLTSDGAFWSRQRRIATPAFRHERIGGFASLMVTRARELGEQWAVIAADGGSVDVLPEFHRLAMRIAGQAFLGEDVGQWSDAIRQAFDEAIGLTTRRVLAPWASPLWVPTPGNLRFRRAISALEEILGGLIEARRGAEDPGDDFLGRLMGARDEQTGEAMDDRQLLDEVKTLFIAGFETVSNALAWTIYELGRHPDWQARVRAEAKAVLEGPVSPDTLRGLLQTRRVFMESLRRYPPVWAVGRTPVQDDTIGGYHVPAGSWVFVSPYVLHHLEAHWPEPDSWDPDRFLPENAQGRHKHVYAPFLLGPRRCIGEHFAMMEGVLVTACLAAAVGWEIAPGPPVLPQPVVTLRPARPVVLHLRPLG
jgi:cytochrome P450